MSSHGMNSPWVTIYERGEGASEGGRVGVDGAFKLYIWGVDEWALERGGSFGGREGRGIEGA